MVEGPTDRWRQRYQDDLAFADDTEHAVVVFLRRSPNVRSGNFEDRGDDLGFELQVRQAEVGDSGGTVRRRT